MGFTMEVKNGTRRALVLCVVLLMINSSVFGRFVVEKNSISVISPDSMTGKHDSAIGNFGVPEYGGTMVGKVVYPEKGTSGCKSFDDLGVSFKDSSSAGTPFILLVDRGGGLF
eukprot:Gb_38952 [translate_table: standard]